MTLNDFRGYGKYDKKLGIYINIIYEYTFFIVIQNETTSHLQVPNLPKCEAGNLPEPNIWLRSFCVEPTCCQF